jgi:hypothetical protein
MQLNAIAQYYFTYNNNSEPKQPLLFKYCYRTLNFIEVYFLIRNCCDSICAFVVCTRNFSKCTNIYNFISVRMGYFLI